MPLTTNFRVNSTELDNVLLSKEYILDNYPEISNLYKQAGLWLWGLNDVGQLGNNTITDRLSPVQTVAGGINWKQVDSGQSFTAAIKTDNTLWLWGSNFYGQLGDNTITSRSSPVQTISGGANWKQVSGGTDYCTAIKTDGTLWTWGLNLQGQLGDNTTTKRSSPVQTVSGGTNWKQVSAGSAHVAAIKNDGTLWLWGYNGEGGLGDNTLIDRSSPVQTISTGTNWVQVSAAETHTAAIKTDSTLWLWGSNYSGELGDNTTTRRTSPIQTVSGGTNWKQVSASAGFTAAIKTDGTLWCWGVNDYGQIGDNTLDYKSSPVQTVSAGTNWKQVDSAAVITAAVKTDGTLWLWGANFSGSLGDNSSIEKSSPVQTVSAGTNWKQVTVAGSFTAAIRDDSDDPI